MGVTGMTERIEAESKAIGMNPFVPHTDNRHATHVRERKTIRDIRVNDDPMQIASVETAVEREARQASGGTSVHVSDFMNQSSEPVVGGLDDLFNSVLLDDDIKKFAVR